MKQKKLVYSIDLWLKSGEHITGEFYSIFFDEDKRNIVLMSEIPEDKYSTLFKRYIIPYEDFSGIAINNEDNQSKIPSC